MMGAWLTPRNTHIPACVTMSNLVVLGQIWHKRTYTEIGHENGHSSRPAFQDQSKSMEPTRIDRLPVTS